MNPNHIIIRQLINNEGVEFLNDVKLCNILHDMGYFNHMREVKQMFNELVSEGNTESIVKYHKGICNRDVIETIIQTYTQRYSMQVASYTMQCIMYGLGLIDQVQTLSVNTDLSWFSQLEKQRECKRIIDEWNTEYAIFNVTPEDAKISIDGYPYELKNGQLVTELDCTEHTIEVEAEMYHKHTSTFTVEASNQQEITIDLVPMFGSMLIMCNAKNSEAFIDGTSVGMLPLSIPRVTSGSHELVIKNPLYKDYRQTFDIVDDEFLNINAKLEENYGMVNLVSNDPEVEIYVDEELKGKGQWNGQLPVGKRKVECKRASFFPKTIEIDVPNSAETMEVQLPDLDAYFGCLKINVLPVGSKVLLDGKEIGKTPMQYKQALTGTHKLKVMADEYGNEIEKEVQIEEGKITEVNETVSIWFLHDLDKIAIGDYYYTDGTYSHMKSNKKPCAGVVFSLEVTEEEKKHGWTHGHIMSLYEDKERYHWDDNWNRYSKKLVTGVGYQKSYEGYEDLPDQRIPAIEDKNGYAFTQCWKSQNSSQFKAIRALDNVKPRLDTQKTSGWYMPSLGQWCDFFVNILKLKLDLSELSIRIRLPKDSVSLLKKYGIESANNNDYWTSTEYDHEYIWKFSFEHDAFGFRYKNSNKHSDYYIDFDGQQKGGGNFVKAVAAI